MRIVLFILFAALVAVLPIWPFDSDWSYGPAIAVGFLLAVNLIVVACNAYGRSRDKP
jgi:peptidoglycan/LPS O-acetylase OafA/YrhL